MALMLTTELLTSGRIIAGRGATTHDSQLFRRKELELPHASIIRSTTGNLPRRRLSIMQNQWRGIRARHAY
jgi:hypothetical protein